jgi:uncharacterized peroxidase-related enzyme
MLRAAPILLGADPPELLRVLFYRADFFGKPSGRWHQRLLRGESEWSVGERELFAAFVSAKNACRFCASTHSAIAARSLGHPDIQRLLDDPDDPGLSPKARAILPFLEKLTVEPSEVKASDIAPLRSAGISPDAIRDAISVVAMFSMMNRLVDALGIEPMTGKQLEASAKLLLERGYKV